jgi:hypothetical protein
MVRRETLTSLESKESQVAAKNGIMPVQEIPEALVTTEHKGFADLEIEIFGG